MVNARVLSVTVVVLSILVAAPVAVAQQPDDPVVRVEPTAIVASGVTPGATVVFFGIAHEADGYKLKLTEFADVATDDDRDGVVRYEIGRPISSKSVFVAVDIRGGRRGMAAGSFKPLVRRDLPEAALHGRADANAARIVHNSDFTIFWIVRPGIGAWRHAVRDGGPDDGDRTLDGHSSAAMDKFTGLPSWPAAPDDFRPGDLIFAVEPLTLVVNELPRGK